MTQVLKAHYDGQTIVLDEKTDGFEVFRQEWAALGSAGLASAYGDDEPEYSLEDVLE